MGRRSRSTGFVISTLLAIALTAGCSSTAPRLPQKQSIYEVYAVRYASLPGYPTHELIADADTVRRTDSTSASVESAGSIVNTSRGSAL